jgi:hypothetical protein
MPPPEKPDPHPPQTPPKATYGSTTMGVIGLTIYVLGLAACFYFGMDIACGAMEIWTAIFMVPLAIYFGIKFGEQKRDYWP